MPRCITPTEEPPRDEPEQRPERERQRDRYRDGSDRIVSWVILPSPRNHELGLWSHLKTACRFHDGAPWPSLSSRDSLNLQLLCDKPVAPEWRESDIAAERTRFPAHMLRRTASIAVMRLLCPAVARPGWEGHLPIGAVPGR